MILQLIWSLSIIFGVLASYAEELILIPLPNGHLHTNFRFNIDSAPFVSTRPDSSVINNFNIFPNSLSNIVTHTNTKNLSIRFTSGYWNSDAWGKLANNGFTSGGNGLELWAEIDAESKEQALENWKFLVNSLSGFFCASLNFVDESITAFPVYSFNLLPALNGTYLLRAALPREPICTENLTPIIKLFPTKGRAGISSLLDGHKLFDSKFVSTSIDVTTNLINSTHSYRKLLVELNNAFDVPTSLNKIKRPLPKPIPGEELHCDYDKFYDSYHCFPSNDYSDELSFDLDKIFGRKAKINKQVGTSRICARVKKEDDWQIIGEKSSQDKDTGHLLYANVDLAEDNCYYFDNNPKKKEEFDIKFKLKSSYNNITIDESERPDIFVTRSLTGYELDKGGFRVVFKNPTDADIDLVLFETLPWYLRIYLSTLLVIHKLATNDKDFVEYRQDQLVKNFSYATASDRKRPSVLEFLLTIPKNSVVTLAYQFDKSLLLYSEYPPDANHGFELEPAVITLIDSDLRPYYILRTATLLLSLPTPDFSMPYNVIILTSTIMALVFGTMFNLLVKRVISEEDYEKLRSEIPQKNIGYFVNLIKAKFFKQKKLLKTE